MSVQQEPEKVVVITGASSGIGRATALALAARGDRVVLAARREEPLVELAAECERLGGKAHVVPTDVVDAAMVDALAVEAVKTFGRIDAWVNNAAVTLFGRFEDTPPEAWRQVVETDLFGYVHGARAALRAFREQGDRGVLVNVASMVAKSGQPYASAYVVSKHGVRALGICLRQELALDGGRNAGIRVSTVMPATVDTPLFQHAANYTGRAVQAMPPVYPPEAVAQAIVACIDRPRAEVFVGAAGRMVDAQERLSHGLSERAMARMVDRGHLSRTETAPPTEGNLFEPMPEGTTVGGGWLPPRALRRRDAMRIGLVAGGLVALTGFAAWRLRRGSSPQDGPLPDEAGGPIQTQETRAPIPAQPT